MLLRPFSVGHEVAIKAKLHYNTASNRPVDFPATSTQENPTMSEESRLISAVHNITRVLSSTRNLDEGLRLTLQVAMEAVNATGGTIWLHEPETLVCRHVVGEKADALRGFVMPDSQGIAGRVFHNSEAEIDNAAHQNPAHYEGVDDYLKYTTHNMVTAPLRYPGGENAGVVQLVNKRSGDFTEDDLRVLDTVASVAAMSLQRVDLEKQARKGALMDFLGRVAHDIKNLDSQISGPLRELENQLNDVLTLLSQEISPQETEQLRATLGEMLGYIQQGTQRMQRYTKYMAEVAYGNRPELVKEQSDLNQAAEQALSWLDGRARKSQVNLIRAFQPLPSLNFDPLLMERVIINLVDNALPHVSSGGTVTTRTRVEDGFAVVEVEDTGFGIFPHVLRAILEGTGGSGTQDGTGLGLRIVKEVAESHGGRFDGESRVGRGTTFRIFLPL
jgi:signal transduction histidine kinase